MKWWIVVGLLIILMTFTAIAGYYSVITCQPLSETDIKFLNEVNKRIPKPNLTKGEIYLLKKVREYEIKRCLT